MRKTSLWHFEKLDNFISEPHKQASLLQQQRKIPYSMKQNTPSVSVIIPLFNGEEYLDALLNSVIHQTLKSIEIIIIDDGSTDNSISIIRDAQKDDERIFLLSQPNLGPSTARNNGLNHAKGKWIWFADSDDWVDPFALERWVNYAEQNKLDFLVGNGFKFSRSPEKNKNTTLLDKQKWGKIISGPEWITSAVKNNEWPHYVWLQLIDHEFLKKSNVRFMEGIYHEDIIWTLDLSLSAKRVGFFETPMYGYRINHTSIMSNPPQNVIEKRACSYLMVIKRISDAAHAVSSAILRKSLLRQANRESGHLLGLIRKKIKDKNTLHSISKYFIENQLHRIVFSGAHNLKELWRALRCYLIIRNNY